MKLVKFIEVLGKLTLVIVSIVIFPLGFGLLCFMLGIKYEANGKRFFKAKKKENHVSIDSEKIEDGIIRF